MESFKSKPLRILILFFSVAALLLFFTDFIIRASYNSYGSAKENVLLLAIAFSGLSIVWGKNQIYFRTIAVLGFVTCNILFIYCSIKETWETLSFVLLQVNFASLYILRTMYFKLNNENQSILDILKRNSRLTQFMR